MAQINPKLNLNRTPAIVDSNSLIFAKNIRIDVDSTIHKDYSIYPMSFIKAKNFKGYVNYGNIIKRALKDITEEFANKTQRYKVILNNLNQLSNFNKLKIVGIVPASNDFYIFLYGANRQLINGQSNTIKQSCIIRYSERADKFSFCDCNWTYNNGNITGEVTNNLYGETILNIAEYDSSTHVPLKIINLSKSKITDDETLYTQTPNIPITNINQIGTFGFTIPNGTYQFFVRYKVRDGFYTNWIPASKEMFAGNSNIIETSFGNVKQVNTHRSSDYSFIFNIEHLYPKYNSNYESFQIGFILATDDTILARTWKHFDFNTTTINFDYNHLDAEEIEVINLINTTYQLYDVGNITSFKNKLYISNYTETEFNDSSLASIASKIKLGIGTTQSTDDLYGDYKIVPTTVNGIEYIGGLKLNTDSSSTSFNDIFASIINTRGGSDNISVKDLIEDCIEDNVLATNFASANKYDIKVTADRWNLQAAKDEFERNNNDSAYSDFEYDIEIESISVNGINININDEENSIIDLIISAITNQSIYMTYNGSFVDEKSKPNNRFKIVITRSCSYKYTRWVANGSTLDDLNSTTPDLQNESRIVGGNDTMNDLTSGVPDVSNNFGDGGKYVTTKINKTYTQPIDIQFTADVNKLHINDASFLTSFTTLIPYQIYKFYIHYVKQTGEITNGYYCGSLTAPYQKEANTIIYPIFGDITIPDGYVACFFSILHSENKAATIFNAKNYDNIIESNCLDINVGCFPCTDNIRIQQNDISIGDSKYHYSSDTKSIRYFGADGIVTFESKDYDVNDLGYAISDYSLSVNEDAQLIKCTPYLTVDSLKTINMVIYNSGNHPIITQVKGYNEYTNMNLLGYICKIYPFNRERTTKYYTDGTGVYLKNNADNTDDNVESFSLTELKNKFYKEGNAPLPADEEKIIALKLIDTNPVFIYSNYNLNYLHLIEEPTMRYQTYYPVESGGEYSLIMRLIPSLTLSSIYEIPSMYKTYTRKTFSIYKKDEVTRFDNTVRSSELEGDEANISIFKFHPNDYYNIPTNRGIIINMIAIGDAILVHTQDSMFKFSGSNTLQSTDGEIVTAENQPFDSGVSELFGSDFGYAGLQYKTDFITTESSYIFFDRDSRVIYAYNGNGQLAKISDDIEKLFRSRAISEVHFANDFYNNRIFVSIVFIDDNDETNSIYPVTLSFSTLETVKGFVSIHDFHYIYAFNTKTKCYFLTNDKNDICSVDKESVGKYIKLELNEDKIYPSRYTEEEIVTKTSDDNEVETTFTKVKRFDSIIDVIDNTNYETIKTLNSISWSSGGGVTEFDLINSDDVTTLKMAEDKSGYIPCTNLRIYTDTCMTQLFDFSKISNDYSITSANSYMYPRYNQGVWSFNYFRNIQNANGNIDPYVSDQNSLIEGKYFVIRFIFNDEFKLETLKVQYNNKI